ncbi:MAG: hypothetical protein WC413_01640 [Candidatus Nanoarchaeia archaeon]
MKYYTEKALGQLICEECEIEEDATFGIQNETSALVEVNIPNPFKREKGIFKDVTQNNGISVIQAIRKFYLGNQFELIGNELQTKDCAEKEIIFYTAEARRNKIIHKIEVSIRDLEYLDTFLIYIQGNRPL